MTPAEFVCYSWIAKSNFGETLACKTALNEDGKIIPLTSQDLPTLVAEDILRDLQEEVNRSGDTYTLVKLAVTGVMQELKPGQAPPQESERGPPPLDELALVLSRTLKAAAVVVMVVETITDDGAAIRVGVSPGSESIKERLPDLMHTAADGIQAHTEIRPEVLQ